MESLRFVLLFAVALSACSSGAPPAASASSSSSPAPADSAATSEPAEGPSDAEDPRVFALIAELDAFCRTAGDCLAAEYPDMNPDEKASGETRAFIEDRRAKARSAGEDVVFSHSFRRFSTRVEHDVRTIIGGHFAVDHLGPEVHRGVMDRLRARPRVYLGVLRRVLRGSQDVSYLSSTYAPNLIQLAGEVDPAAARNAAADLVPLFERMLASAGPPPSSDPDRAVRLQQHIKTLQMLAAP
jgi:hypothetical protein